MKYSLLVAILALSLAALPAIAEDTASGAKEISPEKLKLSTEAFQLAGVDKELKQISAKQVKAMAFSRYMSTIATAGSKEEVDRTNRKTAALQQVFEEDIDLVDEMKSLLIEAFARKFTDQELKDMIAFYKSTAGAKLVKTSPKMTDIVLKRTLSDVVPKLNAALEAAVQEEVLDKKKAADSI